jgi:hypothetical protein
MLFFRADIGFKNGGSYTGDTEDLFVIILKRGFKNEVTQVTQKIYL